MYALYARQSIEKTDSISVDSQISFCLHETKGADFRTYIDKGYSGKDINRPAFEEMIKDIKTGKINTVIVYKLDRISRSILDFSSMMSIFAEYNVEFISSTEKFDTSTPIGRAMLNICIVFAQLERETIQSRISDAYYSRSVRGFYMGGRVPYGFSRQETSIDGIKTSMFVTVPEESDQIRLMYSMYSDSNNSLGNIVNYFVKNSISHLRGGIWTTAKISALLRNPIYVKADVDVYSFFKSQGAIMINTISEFTGYNGCYLYQGRDKDKKGSYDLKGREIVLAPHEGIISSYEWLRCRQRCLSNRRSTKTCKASRSWLAGKIKCGKCGYGMVVVKSNTKWHRYFVCSAKLSAKGGKCTGAGGTVYADVLEDYIFRAIKEKLTEFPYLSDTNNQCLSTEINGLKIELELVENEIRGLLTKVNGANDILIKYINSKIVELDTKKSNIQKKIDDATLKNTLKADSGIIKNHVSLWENICFEDKKGVVDIMISVIRISGGEIDILWNI